MNNLFLTGRIGVGKSTMLKKALDELNIPAGGYVTQKIFDSYYIKHIAKSLYDNEEYIIVKSDTRNKTKIGFPESFENGMISILDKSLKFRDIVVLDELGCAENNIKSFTSKVFEILDSRKIAFGVLKDEECEFLNSIRNRDDVVIIRITEENRDYILGKIVYILKGFLKSI